MVFSEPMTSKLQPYVRFTIGILICFAIRLFPWRPPNIEPITATLMPFGKRMGPAVGFLFGFLNILLFDIATREVGMWTFVTGITYGVIGIASFLILGRVRGSAWQYALFAVVATIIYDLITGVAMGNLLFAMPLREAFVGQIPFTINHLLGNILLAFTLSPIVDRWIVQDQEARMEATKPMHSRH